MIKEIHLFRSPKGTYAVSATALHDLLEYHPDTFAGHIKRWLKDSYMLDNEIRRPVVRKDYSLRSRSRVVEETDYFLSLSMARQIVLHSGVSHKLELARRLMAFEWDAVAVDEQDVLQVLRLTRIMARTSCQELAERMHFAYFEHRANVSEGWVSHRSQMIQQYTGLRGRIPVSWVGPLSARFRRKCQLEQPFELIRLAVMDFFLARGKSMLYAAKMGNLSKSCAEEWGIALIEDRASGPLFTPESGLDTWQVSTCA